jgi:hypothetical protein
MKAVVAFTPKAALQIACRAWIGNLRVRSVRQLCNSNVLANSTHVSVAGKYSVLPQVIDTSNVAECPVSCGQRLQTSGKGSEMLDIILILNREYKGVYRRFIFGKHFRSRMVRLDVWLPEEFPHEYLTFARSTP